MAMDYAVEQLSAALETLAVSDEPLNERLQRAWDEHIQYLWSNLHQTSELNERFKAIWKLYTAPSDDPRSTVLRAMTRDGLAGAATEIVKLALDTAAASARGESPATPSARERPSEPTT